MTERVVCTVATKNFLAHVRTLASSLLKHNPDVTFYLLLADKPDGCFDPQNEPFHILTVDDLGHQDAIAKMSFYYNPFEFCNSLRAYLHDYLLNNTDTQSWLYLDSDIMVFSSLDTIFNQVEQFDIVLSPHALTPVPSEQIDLELSFLRAGVFNSGFLGLSRSEKTRSFVEWYKHRLTYYSFDDLGAGHIRGLFVDQKWLNLAHVYFDASSLLTHPGANIGHWNLHERQLTGDLHQGFFVNGQPLLFCHFSGWDIEAPYKVSKYSSFYGNYNTPAWIDIVTLYKYYLLSNEYERISLYPYSFGYFDTGEPITTAMRREYYDKLMHNIIIHQPFSHARYFRSQVVKAPLRRIAARLVRLAKEMFLR